MKIAASGFFNSFYMCTKLLAELGKKNTWAGNIKKKKT